MNMNTEAHRTTWDTLIQKEWSLHLGRERESKAKWSVGHEEKGSE